MKIKSTTLSFTVVDVGASSAFLQKHFGFAERFNTGDFAYLSNDSMDVPIVLMQTGNSVLPEVIRGQQVSGAIVAFVVDGLELEYNRLKDEGIKIILPIQEDPWGERLFEVMDPNGIVYQIVQWVAPSDQAYEGNNPGQW